MTSTLQRACAVSGEWEADEYHRLSDPQFEWGRRVVEGLVLRGDERVIDAGCGTGRVTALLIERLPAGAVVCLDRSVNMLRAARDFLAPRCNGRTSFVLADVSSLPVREGADVIFSTAMFNWVADHDRLLRQIWMALVPGGRLIAQCSGAGSLARVVQRAHAIATTAVYREMLQRLEGAVQLPDARTTAARLATAGFVDIQTWEADAPVQLSCSEEYRRFVKTVMLRQTLGIFPTEAMHDGFLHRLAEDSARDDPPFVLDYRRLNIAGRKPPRNEGMPRRSRSSSRTTRT